MKHTEPTAAVTAIGNLNITGNVIPANWWRHVLFSSGKPDSTAIVLLSDIVYWYRPAEVRDEMTGAVTGYRKRFHGDKLQRSYQAFADQFGFSKREATDALKRLRDAGLITLELRTVKTSEGSAASNVLFVEPVAQAIADITTGTPVTFKRNSSSVETEQLLRPDVTPPTLKRETYTEITTEITTEIKDPPFSPKGDENRAGVSSKRGTRLPNDWKLPKPWGEWALNELGLPRDQILMEADIFADYWQSLPGAKAVKLDWEKTWRNWIRKSAATKPKAQYHRKPEPPMPKAFGETAPANTADYRPKAFGE